MGDAALDEDVTIAAEEQARRVFGVNTPLKLYHYTCEDAITSIANSRELRESSRGAAGSGIYATSMHPSNCTREQIARNNWGYYGGAGSKLDFVIELDVESLQDQFYTAEKATEGRDVWLIKRSAGNSAPLK